ncbi:MAG: cytochrome P450 [Caldilinea sp.]
MQPSTDTVPILRPWTHFFHYLRDGANPLFHLCALQERIGDVYRLDLGLTKLWVLTRPEHAQHILQNNARNYRKGDHFDTPLRSVIRNGSAVSDLAKWRALRSIALPYFQGDRLSDLPIFVDAAWRSLEGVIAEHCALGRPLNLSRLMECASVSVACQQFGFGVPTYPELVAYLDAIKTLMYGDSPLFFATRLFPWAPLPSRAHLQQAAVQVRQIVTSWIATRLKQDDPRDDFCNALLRLVSQDIPAVQGDSAVLAAMLYDELFQILLAAHETVSAGLAWTTWLLSSHASIRENVAAEIDARPNWAIESAPAYLDGVIKESLRLFPPAWRITRRAIEDDTIGRFTVPAGAPVMLFVFGLHRHPDFWPAPNAFHPERFFGATRHDLGWQWMAFGAGPRSCIGGDMAVIEMKLILAWLMRRYRITPVAPPPLDSRVNLAVTLRLRRPQYVHLHRSSAVPPSFA